MDKHDVDILDLACCVDHVPTLPWFRFIILGRGWVRVMVSFKEGVGGGMARNQA